MPKINQEEYKVLKEALTEGYEWIARDSHNPLCAHRHKPVKQDHWIQQYWGNVGNGYKEIDDSLFQFIKWKDEEPYSIAELIEEYEDYQYTADWHAEQLYKLSEAIRNTESEETEVKNIEWLKNQVDELETTIKRLLDGATCRTRISLNGSLATLKDFRELVNQLELEVLSQEWIDKNKRPWTNLQGTKDYIAVSKIQNLLVPKQEITEEQAYDKIAESFPTTAKEIETVLEKYYSNMFIEISEEMNESIMRAFEVEATSKTIEALTGMTLEQIAEEARNGGIVAKQELPVIPKFVDEFLIGKEDYMLYELFDDEWLYEEHNRVAKWLYDNDELTNKQREIDLVMARDRGYLVEETEYRRVLKVGEMYFWRGGDSKGDFVVELTDNRRLAYVFGDEEEATNMQNEIGGEVEELEE